MIVVPTVVTASSGRFEYSPDRICWPVGPDTRRPGCSSDTATPSGSGSIQSGRRRRHAAHRYEYTISTCHTYDTNGRSLLDTRAPVAHRGRGGGKDVERAR